MRTSFQLGVVDEFGAPSMGLVVFLLASQMEGAEDGPLDVVGQAGQDLLVIVLVEALQVGVDGRDVPRQVCVSFHLTPDVIAVARKGPAHGAGIIGGGGPRRDRPVGRSLTLQREPHGCSRVDRSRLSPPRQRHCPGVWARFDWNPIRVPAA